MRMNVVYLSPHFPPNYYQFSQALKRLGVNVLGIADASYHALRPELKASLTEYYQVRSMEDYDQLLRALGYFTHKYGKIDRIDSHNEYWLETEARLRTDFNIPGTNTASIQDIKYKSRMKQKYIEAGIAVARGRVVETLEAAQAFIDEVDYPVVAKPDKGVGAANTYKIRNPRELEAFFAEKPPVSYIMEEFIRGLIVSFDGLTDRAGQPVFFTSHVYNDGVMETLNEGRNIYYYSLRQVPPDLEEAGRKVLRAFDVREKFFHFEFFRTDDGQIVALEVNMRPPGGYTTDMFNYANDIDIYQEWANILVHNRFTAEYSRKYHCAFISRKLKNLTYEHSHAAILANYPEAVVFHTAMPAIFAPVMGEYAYLVRATDISSIQEMIEYIQKLS
jgi:hypothetical protein